MPNGDIAGLTIGIRHEPLVGVENDITYILEYDSNCFDIALSYESIASYSVPDSISLVFSGDALDTKLQISRANSAILDLTLKRNARNVEKKTQDYRVNLTYGMKRFSVNSSQFQELQTRLPHSILLDVSMSGCPFEDILAEVLSKFRMNVVLDQQTSYSRTCWLSGRIVEESVLIVVDGRRSTDGDRISMDVWSKLERIDDAILEVLSETRIGDVSSDFDGLGINWSIGASEKEKSSLTVTISSNQEDNAHSEIPLFFTVDYQGLLTESFEIPSLGQKQQVSISADLHGLLASWNGNLSEPYTIVYLSDARWKSLERSHAIIFSWKQALEQQIKSKLSSGNRFRSINEFSMSLNMTTEGDSAVHVFSDFFLSLELNGCETNRAVDHCARAAIITGLVSCIDPPRGISGYLELLTGPQSPKSLEKLGSRRTWRDHISQIAQDCSVFAPKTTQLAARTRSKKPGRPPTRLIPTTHPLRLFEQLLEDPGSVVCRFCRFYRKETDNIMKSSK